MIDLDERLDRAADDLWNVVPTTASAAPTMRRPSTRLLATAAASVVFLVALTSVWIWRDVPADDEITPTAPTAMVEVVEQEMQVAIEADVTCDEPHRSPNSFDTYTIEFFADRAERRWLMRATFPDASTYELVATGSVLYPETLHERGIWRGSLPGCILDGTRMFLSAGAPTAGSFTALNLMPELREDEPAFFGGDIDASAKPDGRRTTSWGWADASTYDTGWNVTMSDPDGIERIGRQFTTWLVTEGLVWERTVENSIEGLGTAVTRITMVGTGDTLIEESAFDPSGMTPLEPIGRPDGIDVAPAAATVPVDTAADWCGTYTVVEGDVPAMVAAKLGTTFEALAAVNVDTPGWDSWFPGLEILVPC